MTYLYDGLERQYRCYPVERRRVLTGHGGRDLRRYEQGAESVCPILKGDEILFEQRHTTLLAERARRRSRGSTVMTSRPSPLRPATR
ncbi:hypothetical protein F2981_31535 (plasmid) [Sinorhizobium meliloti]|nr:hypothetical protein [Sinorhizobium meliloti]